MKHVVALSGGKDSTALALRLAEVEPREYTYLCTPTGDELPDMLAHWAHLETLLEKPIERLESGWTLDTLIDDFTAIPKLPDAVVYAHSQIEPCIEYLAALGDATLYVGLRADEPPELRAGGIYDDVPQRFPLREWGWTEADVWRYLGERGVEIPRRTDCAMCYHQRLGEWWDLWRDYPERYQHAVATEAAISLARGKRLTFRSDSRDTWPASLAEMRDRFAAGDIPQGASATDDMFGGGGMCRVCSL